MLGTLLVVVFCLNLKMPSLDEHYRMSRQGPMPAFLKTGFSETDSALEDMAREMANQLRQGLEMPSVT
jgi:hypothetical protein